MGLLPRVVIVNLKLVGLSARRLRDPVLVEHISTFHQANYGVYGVRKMWQALRREGIGIGREHTARLMRLAGVSGKGRSPVITRMLKKRWIRARTWWGASSQLRVRISCGWGDIIHVRTKKGFVYTAFVTDVFSRRIVGWALSNSMRTSSIAAASSQPGDSVC